MNKTCKCLLLITFILILLGNVYAGDVDDNTTTELSETSQSIYMQEPTTTGFEQSHKIIKNKTHKNTKESKNIILNSTTFNDYVTDGKLNENVNPGDTINVQGLLDSKFFNLTVNKPVNITSTGNAYWGAEKGMSFIINKEGAGTNVSNIHFFQTKIQVKNTTDVSIDNITNICNKTFLGSLNNVEELSKNIRITNSYFYCENVDTWACNFKVSGVDGLLVENCTFIEVGDCMNTVYLQIQYNMDSIHKVNNNITLRNCTLDGTKAISQAASCGLVMQGSNIRVENCTIRHNSSNTLFGNNFLVMGVWIDLNWGTNNTGESIATDLVKTLIFRGNKLYDGKAQLASFHKAEIYDNVFQNVTTFVGNSNFRNNVLDSLGVDNIFTNVTNNLIRGNLTLLKGKNLIKDNIILGSVITDTVNNTIENNSLDKIIVSDEENNTIRNNKKIIVINNDTINNNTIIDNQLIINDELTNNTNIYININRNDIKTINITPTLNNVNFTICTSQINHININPESTGVSFINSTCPKTSLNINNDHTLINSTFLNDNHISKATLINTTIIDSENNTKILSKNINKPYTYYFNETGYPLNTLQEGDILIIRDTENHKIVLNKPITITSIDNTTWNGDIIFNNGSEGSNISNMIINATIYINTSNINIINNTIKQQIIINNSNNNTIKNNTINTTQTPITIQNTKKTRITGNNITTTATYTITLDETSQENTITNNTLISKEKIGSKTIFETTNNTIKDNKPKENTTLTLQINPNTKLNIPTTINITLKNNNQNITTGKLLIRINGEQKYNITLTNQNTIQTNITLEKLGENEIKAYYLPTENYSLTTATNKTTVTPIKSYIDVQISQTKINENATITTTMTDEYADTIKDGQVIFEIQNFTSTSEITNGMATTIIPALEEYKGRTLTITYDGSRTNENLTTKMVFNPLKGESFIKLASEINGTNTVITATVTNILGEKINKGYVQFKGQGLAKLVKIEDYKSVLTILTTDTTISATFRNNANYEEATTNITITATKDTNIHINNIITISYGENVTITGTLTDNDNNTLKNMPVSLTVNNKNIALTTDNNGKFTYTTQATIIGTNNILVTYGGNSNYNPTNTSKTFTVQKQDTKITLNPIPTTTYNTNVTLTGTLTDKNGNTLKNMQITIQVNNDTNTTTTNNNGIFTYTFTAPTSGQNNITATYNGNSNYKASNTSTTFNINKQDLKIKFDKIKDVVYGHEVTITGTFTDGLGNARQNIALRIFINGKGVSTRTDNNGRFTVNSKVGSIGTNNVTASHAGGTNYNPTNTSTTFKMLKQDLKITVDKIGTIVYGSKVNITGTLKDGDGNLRANTGVKILINGKSATAKTDKNGKYTFTTKIGKLGINNVTVSHTGGTNYNPTSNSTTYTVVKQDLKITLNKIGTVTYGAVTITGFFTDSKNNPRANTGLKITINGKTATAKTNDKGEFTLTTKVGAIGTNNVTAYHNGGSNYNPTNTTTTFTMKKQDLKVTIDPINTVTYGNSVVITGKFTDASGKVRANSALKIIINGKTLTTRTDASGKFRATSKVGSIGINNVTVSHNGGTGFNPTSTSTTFKMIKQDLKITINPISTVKKGSTITVTGTFTDANGKIRANTNLKVKLNGMEYTTRTDTKGAFTFKATANKVGTNTISMSHAGGANYNPTNCTVLFTVIAS